MTYGGQGTRDPGPNYGGQGEGYVSSDDWDRGIRQSIERAKGWLKEAEACGDAERATYWRAYIAQLSTPQY